MKSNLILAALTPDQIQRAKDINGKRKQITHALICGSHGQLFGTDKQLRKYFNAWDPSNFQPIFPDLFDKVVEINDHKIIDYESTWDLVGILIKAQDTIPTRRREILQTTRPEKQKKRNGFFKRLFYDNT